MFGVSRQAIYKQEKVFEQKRMIAAKVKAMVRTQRMSMPRLGTRKLYYLLKSDFRRNNIKMGRDGLFDCLKREHMLIKPVRNYTKTTWSRHWLYKHKNLAANLSVQQPEQLWVSDITYIKTKAQDCFLSLVTDAYSRRIMGYHVSDNLKTESVIQALKMAVADRVYRHPLMHHSDRGMQYCADPYQQLLQANGMTCSMTDGYDCYQNALAERVNGILKNEFLLHTPADISQLQKIVRQTIETYNNKRPHLSLNMKTPNQIHKEDSVMNYC